MMPEQDIYLWYSLYRHEFYVWLAVIVLWVWTGSGCCFKSPWKDDEPTSDAKPSYKYTLVFWQVLE